MVFVRLDTEVEPRTDLVVDENRQQFIACLAMRGEGKSYLLEYYAMEAFLKGYLILDLHGADNLENAFCIFPSDDPAVKNPMRIPITILAQASVKFEQRDLDIFNSRPMTEKEFYTLNPFDSENPRYFNMVNPPRVPFKKPLILIEKLPHVTNAKGDVEPESNLKALEQIVKVILHCRQTGRRMVLNRMMFARERQ